jgi:hypothetical protein
MSWLEACAYFEFDRANGMRFPPTIAALRVAAPVAARPEALLAALRGWEALGSSGVGGIARYRQYQVPFDT